MQRSVQGLRGRLAEPAGVRKVMRGQRGPMQVLDLPPEGQKVQLVPQGGEQHDGGQLFSVGGDSLQKYLNNSIFRAL